MGAETEEIVENQPPPSGGEGVSGIERAAADMDAMMKLDEPPTPPAPKPGEAAKPGATPPPAPKPGATPPKQDDDEAAFESTIKPNAKAWKTFTAVKKTWVAKQSAMEARIKELESKANPTAADGAKLKDLEERLASHNSERENYEKRLAALDYRQTADFRDKFVNRYVRMEKEAVEFVTKLQKVDEVGDDAGAATQADFEAVRSAQPKDRRAKARELFGENSADVMDYVRELDKIRSEADAAVQNHAENFRKNAEAEQSKFIENQKAFSGYRSEAQKLLESKYPTLFSPDHYKDQPELQKKLIDGYEYVDKAAERSSQMSPDERASIVAVVRSRAAAMPLLYHQNLAKDKRILELEDEITKLRGGDPGKLTDKGDKGGDTTPPRGIDASAAEFDNL